jgi:small subunit ribosomal protein S17e
MGAIKQTFIKKVALELLRKYPEEFTAEYQHNKKKVEQYTDVSSHHLRNRIAGYVTRQKRKLQTQSENV